MATQPKTQDPLKQLEEHLAAQLPLRERSGDFDMSDAAEGAVLAPFPEFCSALKLINAPGGVPKSALS